MINYRTYSYEENEHLFGPGKRLLLFCQGCSIHCEGCINRHLWEFGTGENITVEEIVELCRDADGITLHGGEPLDQSDEIARLIFALKSIGKTTILFTGYHLHELKKPSQRLAWKLADMVVSGRYEKEKRNIYLQFRGSTNQRVYRHRGKYKDYRLQDGQTAAIFRIDSNGELVARGFRDDELNDLFQKLKKE